MNTEKLTTYIDGIMPTYVEQLKTLMRIQSISHDPSKKEEHTKVLESVGGMLSEYGFDVHVVPTKGNPCLVAHLEVDPSAPWITVYNHMDVQPAKEPQWIQEDPFEPIEEDGRIIGRGSTDDKGPALSIVHAINFLKTEGEKMPNIQVIYETEEEIGSPNFGSFLDDNKNLIKDCESVLVSDTIFEGDHPAITYKLRGLARAVVRLKTGSEDMHSGMVGGVVSNAINILSVALGSCVDEKGNVLIPGVLDNVEHMSEKEDAELDKTLDKFDLVKFQEDIKGADIYIDDPKEMLKRIWSLPTFDIHGYAGGQSQGYDENNEIKIGAIKTAIPYEAVAKVSMRLVSGLTPDLVIDKLEKHLKTFHPNIEVEPLSGAFPTTTDLDSPFMDKAVEACKAGFGKSALFVGAGGTIGSIPEFQRFFAGKAVVLLAQSLLSDNYHGPNENFQLQQARDGIKAIAHYLNSVADMRA